MERTWLLIWLIASEVFLAVSLFFWYIGFIFSFELVAIFTILIGSYPIFILVSAFFAWRMFVKKKYKYSLLWSVFPALWYLIVYVLTLFS